MFCLLVSVCHMSKSHNPKKILKHLSHGEVILRAPAMVVEGMLSITYTTQLQIHTVDNSLNRFTLTFISVGPTSIFFLHLFPISRAVLLHLPPAGRGTFSPPPRPHPSSTAVLGFNGASATTARLYNGRHPCIGAGDPPRFAPMVKLRRRRRPVPPFSVLAAQLASWLGLARSSAPRRARRPH